MDNRRNFYKKPQNYNNGYNYSSVAYDYEPEIEYSPQRQPQVSIREFAIQKRALFLQRIKLIFSVAVVFCGCITSMVMHATIEEQRIINNKLQDEITTLQNANNALNAEITEQLSLDYIEQEATTRLGMSEPQAYQICYIDVPKQSYTVQYDTQKSDDDGIMFDISSFFDMFKKD